jgi:hypothetical protein
VEEPVTTAESVAAVIFSVDPPMLLFESGDCKEEKEKTHQQDENR